MSNKKKSRNIQDTAQAPEELTSAELTENDQAQDQGINSLVTINCMTSPMSIEDFNPANRYFNVVCASFDLEEKTQNAIRHHFGCPTKKEMTYLGIGIDLFHNAKMPPEKKMHQTTVAYHLFTNYGHAIRAFVDINSAHMSPYQIIMELGSWEIPDKAESRIKAQLSFPNTVTIKEIWALGNPCLKSEPQRYQFGNNLADIFYRKLKQLYAPKPEPKNK